MFYMSKYRVAFFADSHVGWKAKVRSNEKGINIRVQDGYDALRQVVSQIIIEHEKEPIDIVLIGGDLFHTSRPSPRDIVTVQFYLRKLAERNIPVHILAGNHDATDIKSELAAIAPVADPDKQIFTYLSPYTLVEVGDGVLLHVVSHHGLSAEHTPVITPVEGKINLFSTHGAALDPKNKELMRCADSPREQFVPVELIIDEMFDAKMLGHYHSRYPVGGESLNTWYSGSLVRRGFSDAPGDRGWLLVETNTNGQVTITPHDITQRPQYDLSTIDAENLTSSDVMNLLEDNLKGTTETKLEPVVRQKIINASRAVKEGLDRDRIKELTSHMLSWQLEFHKNLVTKQETKILDASLSNRHSVNILSSYKDWVHDTALTVPEEYRDIVVKDAEQYLKEARDANLEGHTH